METKAASPSLSGGAAFVPTNQRLFIITAGSCSVE
jgi:hypothetical protein